MFRHVRNGKTKYLCQTRKPKGSTAAVTAVNMALSGARSCGSHYPAGTVSATSTNMRRLFRMRIRPLGLLVVMLVHPVWRNACPLDGWHFRNGLSHNGHTAGQGTFAWASPMTSVRRASILCCVASTAASPLHSNLQDSKRIPAGRNPSYAG
jgi:hypothetical protein